MNPENCLTMKITNTMKFVNYTSLATTLSSQLTLLLLVFFTASLRAEGVQQVAPTANDAPVMLETGRAEFGDFAKYDGPANSRLYIRIGNPSERVFLGLSQEYNDAGLPFSGFSAGSYAFRIRYDNGADNPIVHGPFTVTTFNANVTDYATAQFGVYTTTATVGGQRIYEFQPTEIGDYYIEFEDVGNDGNSKVNIPFWDITVANNNVPVNGRVWSRSWAFRTPQIGGTNFPDCVWDRSFNGAIYSYTSDGFVSRIDFQNAGLQGLSFNLAFNSKGPGSSADLTLSRRSIPNTNAALAAAEHQIFLSEPDPLLFPSNEDACGILTSPSTFNCSEEEAFCLEVSVTKPGQVEIVLDFNRNGTFDEDSEDVNLLWEFPEGNLAACIPWNGIRGDGSPATEGDTIDILFVYSQGVQHWSAYDVEYLRNGYCVETVRPICQPNFSSNTLYWDDRDILEDSGTGAPKNGINGFSCDDGIRTWNNFNANTNSCDLIVDNATTGYGDKNTINTWWFASTSTSVRVNIPLVRGSVIGDTEICEGETTTLTAFSNGGGGVVTFSWTGPEGFTATTAEINVSEPGEYCVSILADMGCSANVCRTVVVTDGNNGRIDYPNTLLVCEGEQVTITPTSNNLSDFTYNWTPATGLNATNIPNPTATFSGDITYTVEVTDVLTACRFTFEVALAAAAEAQASFVAVQASCEAGTIVNFVNTSINAVAYSWNFGDPATTEDFSTEVAPSYTYPSIGTYTAVLVATSADGCNDTISQVVTVREGIVIGLSVPDVESCNATFVLSPQAAIPVTYTYFDLNGVLLGTGASLNVPLSGVRQIRVVATSVEGCVEQTTVTLAGGPVDISTPDEVISCGRAAINLGVTNIDINDTLTYIWSPAALFDPATLNAPNPTFIGMPGEYELTLVAVNQFGCTATATIGLVVIDDMAAFDFDQVVDCDGLTYNFTHTGTVTFGYLWDFGGLGTSNQQNPSFTFPGPGTYSVTLSSPYTIDCISPITREVTVGEAALAADFTLSQTDCGEGSVVLTFTPTIVNNTGGTITYDWTFSGGSPASSTAENPSVTITNNGTITATLTVTTSTNCTVTTSQSFNVQFAPLELPSDVTICPGDSTNLNPNADPSVSYTWSPAIGFDANDPNPRVGLAGTYVVTATTTAGAVNCSTTDSITVSIADPIQLILSGPDGPIGDGGIEFPTITTCGNPIDVTATVGANIEVVFTDINGNIIGMGTTISVNPDGRDTLVATATDLFGCTVRDTVVILNQQVDAAPDVTGQNITLCSTQDTTLGVINLDPNDTLTYAWADHPIITGPLDGSTVLISPDPTPGAVEIQVVVTNQFGCDTTLTYTVTIQPFEPNIFPSPVAACFGQPTELNPGAQPVAGYTYQWNPMAGDFSNPANPIVTLTENTTYSVTITDPSTGCSESQTIEVVVAPAIDFMASPSDTTFCEPGTITFTSTNAVGAEVTWYSDPARTMVIGTGNDISIEVATPGTTTIYGQAVDTETGCTEEVTLTATLQDFTPNQYPTAIDACFNTPTTINGGSAVAGYTYEWTPTEGDFTDPANPIVTLSQTTTYMLTITDPATGCSSVQEVTINVAPEINFMTSPTDTTLCEPGTVLVSSSNAVNADVTWYSDPARTMIIGTGNSISVSVTSPGTTTIYGQAVDPQTGCTEEASVTISFSPLTDGLPNETVNGCVGENAPGLFPNGTNPNYVYTYEPAVNVNSNDPNNPIWAGGGSGTVDVTVFNPATGCTVTIPVVVTITDLTGLTGTANPPSIVLGNSSTLTVLGCEGCSYDWVAPNGTISPNGNASTTATPSQAGELIYEVFVSLNGCTEVVLIPLTVTDDPCDTDHVYLPNAFSPNGDGSNDVLRVRSRFIEEIEEFELMIFNRWGQEMYRSFDPLGSWNGTVNGEALEPDVYGFYLRVVCPNGEELIQKGNISLLR